MSRIQRPMRLQGIECGMLQLSPAALDQVRDRRTSPRCLILIEEGSLAHDLPSTHRLSTPRSATYSGRHLPRSSHSSIHARTNATSSLCTFLMTFGTSPSNRPFSSQWWTPCISS